MARLATLGLSDEQAEAVAGMLVEVEEATASQAEAVIERSRAKTRERVQRWREAHQSNVTERNDTLQTVTKRLVREPARVEDKTSTLEIEPQEQKPSHAHGDVAAFKAGLTPDVSEEVIAEFVKVRRKKRGALTGFAAKLFREDAEKCGMSVAEAARECVRSSWITVKPEYFQGRARAGPPRVNPTLVAARELMDELNAITTSEIEGSHPAPRLVAVGSR